jgi:hypothetical protein
MAKASGFLRGHRAVFVFISPPSIGKNETYRSAGEYSYHPARTRRVDARRSVRSARSEQSPRRASISRETEPAGSEEPLDPMSDFQRAEQREMRKSA